MTKKHESYKINHPISLQNNSMSINTIHTRPNNHFYFNLLCGYLSRNYAKNGGFKHKKVKLKIYTLCIIQSKECENNCILSYNVLINVCFYQVLWFKGRKNTCNRTLWVQIAGKSLMLLKRTMKVRCLAAVQLCQTNYCL